MPRQTGTFRKGIAGIRSDEMAYPARYPRGLRPAPGVPFRPRVWPLSRKQQSCSGAGFTIIELLVVVLIIGVLAAAGLAKYQSFAENARRKICLSHLQGLEEGLAVWETVNNIFAENVKVAFGFTPRTGSLTDTNPVPSVLPPGARGAVAPLDDAQPVVGGPTSFTNSLISGPINNVIQDDKIWACPSAVGRYYGGEIQFVPNDYMDTLGSGVGSGPRGTPIGLGGRYFCVVASPGNRAMNASITNGGFPAGWIVEGEVPAEENMPSPCPQPPFRIVVCGCYGTFGTGSGAVPTVPGSSPVNQGGPVGPNGSALSRHAARW